MLRGRARTLVAATLALVVLSGPSPGSRGGALGPAPRAARCATTLPSTMASVDGARQLVTVVSPSATASTGRPHRVAAPAGVLDARPRPVDRPRRDPRRPSAQARGRRRDAARRVPRVLDDLRQRPEPRRPRPLPAPALRGLVGRGRGVARLRLVPAGALRRDAPLRERRLRAAVAVAGRLREPRGRRLQPRTGAGPWLGIFGARERRARDDRLRGARAPAARSALGLAPARPGPRIAIATRGTVTTI